MTTALCRIRTAQGSVQWGLHRDGRINALPDGTSLATLLGTGVEGLHDVVAGSPGKEISGSLLAPVDPTTDVWAAGVTYEVSREARKAESVDADLYRRVYDADRPELFFKSVGWRVRGPFEPIGIRWDSAWNVPEPELGLVLSPDGAVAGYTICNDVSSRSIEGTNALYLPQAKMYQGSCAIGPWIIPSWEIDNPYELRISMLIQRGDRVVYEQTTSTAALHRRYEDLVAYLFRAEVFPHGVILATGTATVPGPDLTLEPDDEVTITIANGLGTLSNRVERIPIPD